MTMKILIIMAGFFPGRKFGGPPVSVNNFCNLMCDIADCYIVTCNHDLGEKKPYHNIKEGWNSYENIKVMYVSDPEYRYATFLRVARELKPDYIYLQGLFQKCILPCLLIAKKECIKVVLAPRGELCTGAFNKKYKKLPYIWFLRIVGLLTHTQFQSTSDDETENIIHYLGTTHDRIHLLTNVPSIPHNLPAPNRKEAGVGRFIFVSRIVSKKNLLSAIQCFNGIKGRVVFDIYGPKEDENYWQKCEQAINVLPKNVVVTYKGILSHNEVHSTFCQYDAFIFPTFSENYGHVIAEALASGCIPIISNQTPWSDINKIGIGWALPLNNPDGFKKAIQTIIDMDNKSIELARLKIENYLSSKLRLNELKTLYHSVFK